MTTITMPPRRLGRVGGMGREGPRRVREERKGH